MSRPYNTVRGIKSYLGTLKGLNKLIAERHTAGYERHEPLDEFFVLGRWHLDSCGNTSKITEGVLKDAFLGIADVIPASEALEFILIVLGENLMIMTVGSDIPREDIICPVCGKGWTIEDCHDITSNHSTNQLSLWKFVGKTLTDVKAAFGKRTDALYSMQPDILIRNDRFIDLSPKYPNPKHGWEKGVVKNRLGWASKDDGITDAYIIRSGDEGFFSVWEYFHKVCNRRKNRTDMEAYFRNIFEEAGFKDLRMTATENQYCPCEHCAPWFNVNTTLGTILIGWRKRVMNIDWSSASANTNFSQNLFPGENVTKGQTSIHACSREKAIEYLRAVCTGLKFESEAKVK